MTVTALSDGELEAGRAVMPSAIFRQLDVRDEEAVASLVSGFDRLDHLVNCAGAMRLVAVMVAAGTPKNGTNTAWAVP